MRDFTFLRQGRILLLALVTTLFGAVQTMAETMTEDFESVNLVDPDTWSQATELSNGWQVVGGYFCTSDNGNADYVLSDDAGWLGKGVAGAKNSTQAFIVTQELTGEVTFMVTASGTNAAYVRVYEAVADGDTYTLGNELLASREWQKDTSRRTKKWEEFKVDLAATGKRLAIVLAKACMDHISATLYEEGKEVKALGITAFATTTPAVAATSDHKYEVSFTVDVLNKGNVALATADGATVSLLNSAKQVIATSDAVALDLDGTDVLTLNYTGDATADATLTFYVKENVDGKEFETPVTVDVTAYGARFATDFTGSADYFGFIRSGETATRSYAISNNGNGPMTVTVEVPAAFSAPASLTVAPGATEQLTVTINTAAVGAVSGNIVLTTDAIDLQSMAIAATGYVFDSGATLFDFNDNKAPDRWENQDWEFAGGEAFAPFASVKKPLLTTPRLVISNDSKLVVNGRLYNEYGTLVVRGSDDNGETWEAYTKEVSLTEDGLTAVVISDIPTTVNMLQFDGSYVYIDALAATFSYDMDAPKLVVYDANNQAVESGVVLDFAIATEGEKQSFTVKNEGTGTLGISAIDHLGDNVTVDLQTETIGAGESASLDFIADLTNPGVFDGEVTFTTTGGVFTVKIKSIVPDPEKLAVDFSKEDIPARWQNEDDKWVKAESDGETYLKVDAYTDTRTYALTTSELTATENAAVALIARRNSYYDPTLMLAYKSASDAKAEWQTIDLSDQLTTTEWTTVITSFPAASGSYLLQIVGNRNVDLLYFYGFEKPAVPVLMVLDEESNVLETGAACDFGNIQADATVTYTLKNDGNAQLTISSIAADNAAIAVSAASASQLNAGETATFTVTLKAAAPFGEKSGTVTVTTNAGDFTIAVTGQTVNPKLWVEDFAAENIPAGWLNDGWTVEEGAATAGFTTATLTTPRLTAAAGETLAFEATTAANLYAELKVEYATDRNGEWTELEDAALAGSSQSYAGGFTAPAAGDYYLRFTGKYVSLDHFVGFMLAEVGHELALTAADVPAEGAQFAEYTATATVQELAGVAEEATATLYVGGEAVATDQQTVAENGVATFTLTFTPDEGAATTAYVEVAYAGGTLKTTESSLTIAAAPVLDESEATEIAAGTYGTLILKRSFIKGWNTICLPFDVEPAALGEGISVYQFDGYANGEFAFSETTETLTAGTPYIVCAEEATAQELMFHDVAIVSYNTTAGETFHNGAYFIGTYAPVAVADLGEEWLVFSTPTEQKPQQKLTSAAAEGPSLGYRGFFRLPADATADDLSVAHIALTDKDGVVTAINNVPGAALMRNGKWSADSAVYDLQGRRVSTGNAQRTLPAKGLYISGGKKQVIR